ncbi:hypothetical protein AALO_G00023070 [Alosa alosa]|uniref:Transcobalamin-like C-terminal domain-containing protein n=1 Tax=Alosa alosa TaxID=278164 RepID=A0AAV6HAE4_9TELE|nr:hypothetical protein AALO_G00023070 [Alosa alosa]
MALRLFTVLCFTALVQLLGLQITAEQYPDVEIHITVQDKISNEHVQGNYKTLMRPGGILLGAMKRLTECNQDFKYNVTYNNDYGYYLEKVNGVAGNDADHTYWQILSNSSGKLDPTNVGVGCYIPKAYETIVFNFTKW